jgi:hypothetical protein
MTPFELLRNRIEVEGQHSEVALCDTVLNGFEMLLKYAVTILVAVLPTDELGQKEKYSREHLLLRASGVGDSAAALHQLSTGPMYSSLTNRLRCSGWATPWIN